MNVVIVGAGIGGLAAAVALKRRGHAVKVYERSKAPRELGFALLLAPNAVHALRALGLAEVVANAGHAMKRGEIRRLDGQTLRRLDSAAVEAALGEPTVVALRPVLHGALLGALTDDELVLGAPARGCEQTANGAALILEDGSRAEADVLVGADGVGSVIRQALHPQQSGPVDSGLFALRGVAHGVTGKLGELGAAQYFGPGVECGLARASDDVVYWYVSLKAPLTDALVKDPLAWLAQYLEGAHAPLRDIALATKPEDLRFDRLMERPLLSSWGAGAITLLGDAAHPMLPHAGQGAAQALEDAVALGQALSSGMPVPTALRRYEAVRGERTSKIVKLARRNARMGSLRGPVSCWLRDAAVRMVPEATLLKTMISLGRPPEVLFK